MPKAKELKFRVDDRPGLLGEIGELLGSKNVNLIAVNAWIEDGQGVLRMVVDKPAAAKKALAARGWSVEEKDVLEIEVPDRPGALGRVAKALGEAGVNIEYVFLGTGGARKATVFLGVSDLKTAAKAVR